MFVGVKFKVTEFLQILLSYHPFISKAVDDSHFDVLNCSVGYTHLFDNECATVSYRAGSDDPVDVVANEIVFSDDTVVEHLHDFVLRDTEDGRKMA